MAAPRRSGQNKAQLVVGCAVGLWLGAGGCSGPARQQAPPTAAVRGERPVELRLELPLPEGLGVDVDEGFAHSVTVILENPGGVPVALTEAWVEGIGTGRRQLTVSGGPDRLRAFGFLPPGESLRYRLGVSYPRPGTGALVLRARVRVLPAGTPGKVMEEISLPLEGEERVLEIATTLTVAPRRFDRRAALARVEGSPRETAYSRTLGGWVLVMPATTLLVTPTETREFSGLSLAAVHLMDHYEGAVPVLDTEGRLREVPKGPVLRVLLEESLRSGRRISTAEYAPGKEALSVE